MYAKVTNGASTLYRVSHQRHVVFLPTDSSTSRSSASSTKKHKWGLLASCDEDVGTVWSDFENYVPQKTLFRIHGKLWGKREAS